jgi:multidrug resistance efflux pump
MSRGRGQVCAPLRLGKEITRRRRAEQALAAAEAEIADLRGQLAEAQAELSGAKALVNAHSYVTGVHGSQTASRSAP